MRGARTAGQRVLSIIAALLFVLAGSQADFAKSPSGHRLVDHAHALQALQTKLAAIRYASQSAESGSTPALPVQWTTTLAPSRMCKVVLPTARCRDGFAQFVSWEARAPPMNLVRPST